MTVPLSLFDSAEKAAVCPNNISLCKQSGRAVGARLALTPSEGSQPAGCLQSGAEVKMPFYRVIVQHVL